MTTNPPGNDAGTPIHDRTAAAEGHEIRPGVTVPSWAQTTPLEDGRDADLGSDTLGTDAVGRDAVGSDLRADFDDLVSPSHPVDASDVIPASEQLPATPHDVTPGLVTGPGSAGDGAPSGSVDGSAASRSTDGSAASGSAGESTGSGKADAAKGAAQDVAGDAKAKAADVAGTAKEQAANVATEATDHAKQLYGQASETLKQQAGEQQQRAASGLKSLGEQLGRMADNDDEQGVASKVVRDLSNRAGSAAGFLENRDPGSLLDEVKSFAAKRPGTFIALAAGAGILAGRLTKALATEVKHEQDAEGTGTGTGTSAGTTGSGV